MSLRERMGWRFTVLEMQLRSALRASALWMAWRLAPREMLALDRYRRAVALARRWNGRVPNSAETAEWIGAVGEGKRAADIEVLRQQLEYRTTSLAERAVVIADEACSSDIEVYGVPDVEPGDYGLADGAGRHVPTIDQAGFLLRQALDWLQLRGLAELYTADTGEHRIRLLTAADPQVVRAASFGPWLKPGVDPDPADDAFVLFDFSGCCGRLVGMRWGALHSDLGRANYPRPHRYCLPLEVK